MYPVNPPAALRRYFSRGVIEILIFGFQETVINFIEFVVEYLLGKSFSMRSRIGSKQNPVLVFVEEFSGSARLASQFAYSGGSVDGHIGKSVEILGDILQVFRKIAHVQDDKLSLGMFGKNTVSGFQQFGIAGKVATVERPVRMVVQFFISVR